MFGVCCEVQITNAAVPSIQILYLVNRGLDTGKGANNVVSMVHHYLKHNGMGAKHLTAHASAKIKITT